MALLWEHYSQTVPALMRHAALYFARFRPGPSGTNLYVRLFRELALRRTVSKTIYSTLNYELVLELSAVDSKLRIGYGVDTVEEGVVAVWKLHGSCDFHS